MLVSSTDESSTWPFPPLRITAARLAVLGEVDAFLLAELVDDPVHYGFVEVVTAEVGVARSTI